MDYTTDWIFTVTANNRTVNVIWAGYANENIETHRLIVVEDGMELRQEENIPLVDAAIAFRFAELREEYRTSSNSMLEAFVLNSNETNLESWFYNHRMEVLFKLAEQSFKQKFVGQRSNESLFLQDVGALLNVPMDKMWEMSEDFIADKKLGLFGAIIIPYTNYAKQLISQEAAQG